MAISWLYGKRPCNTKWWYCCIGGRTCDSLHTILKRCWWYNRTSHGIYNYMCCYAFSIIFLVLRIYMQHFATKKNIFTHTLLLILFCTNLRIFLLCQHIHKKNNTNVRIIFYYEHVSYKFIIVVVVSSLILLSSINILLSLSSNSKLENSALAGLPEY